MTNKTRESFESIIEENTTLKVLLEQAEAAMAYAIWQYEDGGTPMHNHWSGRVRDTIASINALSRKTCGRVMDKDKTKIFKIPTPVKCIENKDRFIGYCVFDYINDPHDNKKDEWKRTALTLFIMTCAILAVVMA